MELTVSDAVVMFYNYAVVLSGGYMVMRLDVQGTGRLLAFSIVLALVWTAYFRVGMVPRIGELFESEESMSE